MSQAVGATAAAYARAWREVDMNDGRFLGRICTDIARLLVGEHKPTFDPAADHGDYVVVINAAKLNIPRDEEFHRIYKHTYRRPKPKDKVEIRMVDYMKREKHHFIVERTVWRMLPRNPTRRHRLNRMFIYSGTEHPFKDNILRTYVNPSLYPNFYTGRLLPEPSALLSIPSSKLF